MPIDIGDIPTGTPPTTGEKLQIRTAIGLGQTDAPTFNSLGVTNTATANVFSTSAAALQTAGYLGVARAINLIDTAGISWSSTSTLLGATGTNLLQDAAGILAQRNGTAKQTLRIYNTYTSATVYERAVMDWNGPTPGNLQIGTEFMGSGSGMAARPIDFVTGGVVRMSIAATGAVTVASDLTLSGSGSLRVGGILQAGANQGIQWGTTRSLMASSGDGLIEFYNSAVNGFNRLNLGGTTSAFPAIKRSGTGIHIVLADDSGFAPLTAGAITGPGGTGINSSGVLGLLNRITMYPPSDGVLTWGNNAGGDFGRFQLGGTADTHPAIARDGAGIKFTGAAAGLTSWIKVPAVTVSALPAAATAGVGARAFVNNALNPVFGNAVVGSGLSTVPVYSDGTNWNVG